jgi:hypothetical protein
MGHHFFCHPQYMNFGVYDQPVNAHLGAFQAFKSDDAGFRKSGFKLENVYAGPGAIALLLSGFGRQHQRIMERLPISPASRCVPVTPSPGRIQGQPPGARPLSSRAETREDLDRYQRGWQS